MSTDLHPKRCPAVPSGVNQPTSVNQYQTVLTSLEANKCKLKCLKVTKSLFKNEEKKLRQT